MGRYRSRQTGLTVNQMASAFGGANPSLPTIKMFLKEKLERLYKNGSSMMEIARGAGCSLSGVKYWMDKYNISRRSRSEATYVKRNPNGNPFKVKHKLNKTDILLKGLGLGIYWGEGDKSSNNTQVRMSNTDPYLIKKFKGFLAKIYGVREEKFKYSLVMFNDSNRVEVVKFWEDQLGIKRNQLGKIIIIPPQGRGTYKKKNQFGVLTITVCNKKLKEKILGEINKL